MLYPAYYSYKAVKTKNVKEYVSPTCLLSSVKHAVVEMYGKLYITLCKE